MVPLKRLWSGDTTNARIAEELRRFKPGLILLRNNSHETPFNDWLNSEYRLVYLDGQHRLYARPSVIQQARR